MKVCKLFIVVAFLLASSFVYADDKENNVIAHFSKALSLQELSDIMSSLDIQPSEFYFQDGDISGGYRLNIGETVSEAVLRLSEKHEEALLNILKGVEDDLQDADVESVTRLKKLHVSISETINKNSLKIRGVKTQNIPALQELFNLNMLDSIKPVPLNSQKSKMDEIPFTWLDLFIKKVHAATVYYVAEKNWVPRSGTSQVTQTYSYNSFVFPNVSGFSSFGGIMIYEHETQVYDNAYANYDNYWSSNMPNSYYDTPFSDTIDTFTIGTSNASSLKSNTQYWTYMALKQGSVSSASVIIKGQLGHRSPSWCYSTWCIFADMTTKRTKSLVSYTAPVYTKKSWTYNP